MQMICVTGLRAVAFSMRSLTNGKCIVAQPMPVTSKPPDNRLVMIREVSDIVRTPKNAFQN